MSPSLPRQIIIRMSSYTILIFNSGQCRLMGRISLEPAQLVIQSLSFIYTRIIQPLIQVSQTIVCTVDSLHVPINLYKFAHTYSPTNNGLVQFEAELFPALSLHMWPPLHVNVFSTGKVIILGCNACTYASTIMNWLNVNLLLL